MEGQNYRGFDDTNIEKDFKPKKTKEDIPDIPKFLEEKRKKEKKQGTNK